MNSIEMRKEIEASIRTLNELIMADSKHDEISKQLVIISENVSKLNTMLTDEEFMVLRASDRPMYNAIMALEVSKVTLAQDKENGMYKLDDGKKILDLAAFNRFCAPTNIGHEPGWVYRADYVARLVAAYATAELGGDWKNLLKTYRVSKKTEQVQKANPISKTSITKALQSFVDAIIFEDNGKGLNRYKITSQDVAFMVLTACKAGKTPKSVTMPKSNTIIKQVIQIINRIMTNTSYDVLYDRNK